MTLSGQTGPVCVGKSEKRDPNSQRAQMCPDRVGWGPHPWLCLGCAVSFLLSWILMGNGVPVNLVSVCTPKRSNLATHLLPESYWNNNQGAGEMAEQFRAFVALVERAPRLHFQHPRGGSQPSATPVPGHPTLSSALHWVPHMRTVHTHTCMQANPIRKKC